MTRPICRELDKRGIGSIHCIIRDIWEKKKKNGGKLAGVVNKLLAMLTGLVRRESKYCGESRLYGVKKKKRKQLHVLK